VGVPEPAAGPARDKATFPPRTLTPILSMTRITDAHLPGSPDLFVRHRPHLLAQFEEGVDRRRPGLLPLLLLDGRNAEVVGIHEPIFYISAPALAEPARNGTVEARAVDGRAAGYRTVELPGGVEAARLAPLRTALEGGRP
jgi:hypothetical protein